MCHAFGNRRVQLIVIANRLHLLGKIFVIWTLTRFLFARQKDDSMAGIINNREREGKEEGKGERLERREQESSRGYRISLIWKIRSLSGFGSGRDNFAHRLPRRPSVYFLSYKILP